MIKARITKPCPRDHANIFSRLFFIWMVPLFKLGRHKDIDIDDVFKYSVYDDPVSCSESLSRNWIKELKMGKTPKFFRAAFETFGWNYILNSTWIILAELFMRPAQPFVVGKLITYFTNPEQTTFGIAFGCAIYIATSSGQILNIYANDLQAFDFVYHDGIYIILAPLQTIVVMTIMWQYIGTASVAGLVILLLFVPFQGLMWRMFEAVRRTTAVETDKRVKLMSEIVSAMRLIKMYCWEKPFADLVADIRKHEIDRLRGKAKLGAINRAVYFIGPRIMMFASLVTYVLMGGILDPQTVFATMALYNVLSLSVTGALPAGIACLAELLVACRRVQTILELEEKSKRPIARSSDDGCISLRNYSAKWNKSVDKEDLANANLEVTRGQLVVIVGAVGSGKTCLLYSLLSEVETTSGDLVISGMTSYAPQESWCFGTSIRDNILLGAKYNAERYNEVIRVCGLERDLDLFPDRDLTLIGEKGYTLSGGQKARVTLARAVYADADVYLLDDPLSAVDPGVAKHIFNKCIKGFLNSKTVILVTHQLQFIKSADKIVYLENGNPSAIGTFDELIESGVDFLSVLKGSNEKVLKDAEGELDIDEIKVSDEDIEFSKRNAENISKSDEEVIIGSIDKNVYWTYFKAGASPILVVLCFANALFAQGLYHYTDFWLSAWTENYQNINITRTSASKSEKANLVLYTVLMLVLFVMAFISAYSVICLCLSCAIKLHNRIFNRLLIGQMTFFERTPMGRILNRFTRDMGLMDSAVPETLSNVVSGLMLSLGIVATTIVVSPYLIMPALILGVLAVPIRNMYISTSRSLKRLDAITKSPTYSHVATTFDGLTTIRAFGLEQEFDQQFIEYTSDSYSTRHVTQTASRTLGVVLDCFSSAFIAFVCLLLVCIPNGVAGGNAGLALSSSMLLLGVFQYSVRETTEFENQMVSAERILEYEKIDVERDSGSVSINPQWPQTGSIQYNSVGLIYPDSDKPVLEDITFKVEDGDKIGIVGRTGAGKTSLLTVLFRLAETTGSIVIDGLDTKNLTLEQLRKNISIIPQDPVLFSGSIRRNLDPFSEYTDDRLWDCLTHANLDVLVREMNGQLDAQVTEGGSNLSVGQRQLLCLARALLKQNKILVLDEATANVDHETDELIQKTIRSEFAQCTVLTIAHRINTIIDADKVLVTDAGRVVEFDVPHLLLEQRNTFYEMVQQTGPQISANITELAKSRYDKTDIA